MLAYIDQLKVEYQQNLWDVYLDIPLPKRCWWRLGFPGVYQRWCSTFKTIRFGLGYIPVSAPLSYWNALISVSDGINGGCERANSRGIHNAPQVWIAPWCGVWVLGADVTVSWLTEVHPWLPSHPDPSSTMFNEILPVLLLALLGLFLRTTINWFLSRSNVVKELPGPGAASWLVGKC